MKANCQLMRNRFFLALLILCFANCAAFSKPTTAKTTTPATTQPSPVQYQQVDYTTCNKTFKIDSQKLFYLTLAGVNANRFKIDEIQSNSGYVLFTVAQKQFLASVISLGAQTSMLKITPCNNMYYFPAGIVQNMFKYIELNINTPVEKLGFM